MKYSSSPHPRRDKAYDAVKLGLIALAALPGAAATPIRILDPSTFDLSVFDRLPAPGAPFERVPLQDIKHEWSRVKGEVGAEVSELKSDLPKIQDEVITDFSDLSNDLKAWMDELSDDLKDAGHSAGYHLDHAKEEAFKAYQKAKHEWNWEDLIKKPIKALEAWWGSGDKSHSHGHHHVGDHSSKHGQKPIHDAIWEANQAVPGWITAILSPSRRPQHIGPVHHRLTHGVVVALPHGEADVNKYILGANNWDGKSDDKDAHREGHREGHYRMKGWKHHREAGGCLGARFKRLLHSLSFFQLWLLIFAALSALVMFSQVVVALVRVARRSHYYLNQPAEAPSQPRPTDDSDDEFQERKALMVNADSFESGIAVGEAPPAYESQTVHPEAETKRGLGIPSAGWTL